MNGDTTDFNAMMQRYQQELLRMQQATSMPSTVTPPETESPTVATPPEPETQNDTFTAALQVHVTTAKEALPIPNALVVIRRQTEGQPEVAQIRLTDISGLTEPVILPATDPSLTLQPQTDVPLVLYEIDTSAPGYYRVRNSDVPLFGGIPTIQPVSLVPLPEFDESENPELIFRVPRNTL